MFSKLATSWPPVDTHLTPLQFLNEMTPKRWFAGLTILSALAMVLRLLAIDTHSIWYDEAVTIALTKASTFDLCFGHARDAGNPPLYWLVAKAWTALWGTSAIAVRLPSVFFGVAAVPLIALVGRRLVGAPAGLIAAVLWAVSPLQIELSDEARCYTLLHCLVLTTSLLFLRWLERQRVADFLLYGLSICALMWTHYYGLFIPISHGIVLLCHRDYRRHLTRWLGLMVGAALLWSLWLPSFLSQIRTPVSFSRYGETWLTQFMATPVVFAFGRTLAWRGDSHLYIGLAISGSILAFWWPALFGLRKLSQSFSRYLLAISLLLPISLPLIAALLGKPPLFHHRAATVALPFALLLTSYGYFALSHRLRLLTIMLLSTLTVVSLFGFVKHPLKDDWKATVPVMLNEPQEGEIIIIDKDDHMLPFMYYADRQEITPPIIIGVVVPPSLKEGLTGFLWNQDKKKEGKEGLASFLWNHGKKSNRNIHDCSQTIRAAKSIQLALCVPNGNFDQYQKFFGFYGFRLTRKVHFEKVDVSLWENKNATNSPLRD